MEQIPENKVFSEDTEKNYHLLTHDLQGVINGTELKEIMEKRSPIIYWGTAPTSQISVAYLLPALKMRDVVNSGCELVVLIADLHAFLDNLKSSLDKISLRSQYYIKMTKALLNRMGVDLNKVKFVIGSEFQLKPEYTLDVYKLASITNTSQCKHAGAEVVKQSKDPQMTSLLYPSLQAIDMIYLNADAFLGGNDQIKLNCFACDYLPKIGYTKKNTYLMTPMIGGIRTTKKPQEDGTNKKQPNQQNDKMSSSDASSKIDLLAPPEVIKKVINKAYYLDGDVVDNSLLDLMKNLVFKLIDTFTIVKYNSETKVCEPYKTYNYEELKNDLSLGSVNGGLHPADFKESLANFLIDYLKPIRDEFDSDESRELIKKAYEE